MRVSFVVPTYRRRDALAQTLSALIAVDFPDSDYEVIVVDDGSGDGTAAVVEAQASLGPRISYVQQPNSGVATARNHGARRAAGDLLVFLDDDILVEPDHVRAHLAVQEAYGPCMVNGHWEFSEATRNALQQTPFGRYRIELEDQIRERIEKQPLGDGRLRPIEVTAANLGVPADLFWELGGFDEDFPFAGYEDQDFSFRAREHGCRFVYDPSIRLEHNDERVTLEQFCRRQQRGAVTSVYLVARHPEAYADRALLLENAPITEFDPWSWRIKKTVKAVYATPLGVWVAHHVVRAVERWAPESPLLRRLYEMTLGAYLFRGVREGLSALPEAQEAALGAMRRRFADA